MHIGAEQSSPIVGVTNNQAEKELAEAEGMIKYAALLIQRGLRSNFSDIESEQAVLAQARREIAESYLRPEKTWRKA